MKTKTILAILILVLSIAPGALQESVFAGDSIRDSHSEKNYSIENPYERVDWAVYGQYKAALHVHSTNSDGGDYTRDMVENHYAKGYSILAMTDHNYLTQSLDKADIEPVSSKRMAEIQYGAGRGGKGMIGINNTNEQSAAEHINTFFAPFNNKPGDTMAGVLAKAETSGGVSHINHPGRYTGGANSDDGASVAASNDPVNIKKYLDLFMAYPSCAGMEIVNKIDCESKSDRILWDNILKQTMPEGRPVWGFSGDDAHSKDAIGYSWIVMLMPELTQSAAKAAMTTGAFYAVSRVSRLDGINKYSPDGGDTDYYGNPDTLYLLEQPTPGISGVAVSGNTITITGTDCDLIEWIADGAVIYTGASLDLDSHLDKVNSYVRAQLKSSTGIAFTQPFGVKNTLNEDGALSPGEVSTPPGEASNPPAPGESGSPPAQTAEAAYSKPIPFKIIVVLVVGAVVFVLVYRRLSKRFHSIHPPASPPR